MTNLFTCFSSSKVCQGSPKGLRLLLALFMVFCVGVGNVWGITVSDISTSAATTLTDGGEYVVATAYNGTYLTTTVSSGWGGTTTSAGSAAIFTVHGSKTGFYLTCSAGTLAPATSKTFNAYDTGSSNNLSINASGEIQNLSNTSWKLRLNGSFRWYSSSTGSAVYLFAVSSGGDAITLDKNGGSTNGAGSIAANATTMTISTAPVKVGHSVEGYYTTSACATKIATAAGALQASITVSGTQWTNSSSQWKKGGAATFYTNWSPKVCAITLDKGTSGTSDGSVSYTYGNSTKTGTITHATKTGYSLNGYYTAASGGTKILNADGTIAGNSIVVSTTTYTDASGNWAYDGTSLTLYAQWTINTYTVHWKVNGDNDWEGSSHGSPSTSADYNTKPATIPAAPESSDCDNSKVFVGWTNSEYSHKSTAPTILFKSQSSAPAITENTTFHAVFADAEVDDPDFVGYEKVTSAPTDWTAYKYVLATENTGNVLTGKDGDNNWGAYATMSTSTENTSYEITVTEVSTGVYKLCQNSKYLSLTANDNKLYFASSYTGAGDTHTNCDWKIYYYSTGGGYVIESTKKYTINKVDNCYRAIQFNSDRFACYKYMTQTPAYLYKRVEEENITYSNYATTCVEVQCATPTFGIAEGTYIGEQSVTISCATKGATIYYTTDGTTTPSSSSTEYTGAISVSSTTTIKAIAVKDGLTDSEVASATYTIRSCKEYNLVTDASALGIGDKIVILDNSGTYAMSTTQNSKNRGVTTDFVLNSSTVRVPDVGEVQPITLEAYADGYWYFKVGDDSYLAATGTSEAQLKSQTKSTVNTNSTGKWSIALVSSAFTVKTNDGKTYNTMRYNYNSGSPIFSCYDGDKQTAVKVYAYQNTAPTIETNTASLSGFSATYGGSASDAQNVYVSGRNLNGNITVTPPTGYEIKESGDASYSSSAITLTPSSKKVSVTLNVRLAAGNYAGNYNGNLTLVGYNSEASTNVALTGTVAKMTPVITFTLDETAALANTAVGYTLSSTSSATALTFSYKLGGSAVSRMITNDTENKTISISQAGTYTIQVNQAGDDNHNAAAQAEQVLTITMRDVFKDMVNGYSDINGDDTGSGITTPTFAEMEDGAQNTCHSTTRYLIGWIKAADLTTIYSGETGYLEDAAKYEDNKAKIVAPGAETTASGVTWYAVWAEEEE